MKSARFSVTRKRVLSLLLPLVMVACKKDPELTPVNETLPMNTPGQVTPKGAFANGAHPTSGTVSLVQAADGTRSLAFKDFKTDPGPDLRVYLAEDRQAKNFVEVALLTKSGTFSLPLPADAKPEQRKFVLIWCRQFSVLFGSAELQ